jgi:exonuclease SbcD
MRILHFADAHIDIDTRGRHDPESGLPARVLDFLKALDTIVDTAIRERVDLVLFAGDAYKDRTPAPTYQREWGRRIIRLSQAGILTLLLVGNHDLSPAAGRAHTLQEYDTLQVPHVVVAAKPALLGPEQLDGLPLQFITLPWINRSGLIGSREVSGMSIEEVNSELEGLLTNLLSHYFEEADPNLPLIFTAHASVQGAVLGAERTIMLGHDLVLPGSMVRNPRLSYTALGHIHKAQDLNEGLQPPVVYPGSIERVDFGEAADDKYFVIATVESGQPTRVEWRKLGGRRFIDRRVIITSGELFMAQATAALPPADELQDAIFRLTVEYDRNWEPMLDEAALRAACVAAFDFHLIRRPQVEARIRIPGDQTISSLTHADLLNIYWDTNKTKLEDAIVLTQLAGEIINSVNHVSDSN